MTPQPKKNNSGQAQIQVAGEGQFRISGDLDYQTIPRVLKSSQSMFAGQQSLTIDLSEVNRSNSAGLALLIEWMRFAKAEGCSIKFLNIPEQMHQVAQLCGVEEKLPV